MDNHSTDEIQEENLTQDTEEINENLEEVISSYDDGEISVEALHEIAKDVGSRLEFKSNSLPPVEAEIDAINKFIETKKVELEKAKKSSVFVNDLSDEVEFHYSDHRTKNIEEEIKELLNKRYQEEKEKFKLLEELEELEARNSLITKLLESYDVRDKIAELIDYSNEVINDLVFDIEDYSSITEPELETIEAWENNWNIIIEIIGKCNIYKNDLTNLVEYFEEIKKQLEQKDPETKFVHDELEKYPELEPLLQEVSGMHEENLLASIAAVYELAADYDIGEDYLPENKSIAIGKVNKLKSFVISIRTTLDGYKLEYKDFRKSINNIFVLLNRVLQRIENQQKLLKNQQEQRIKKIKDIVTQINRTPFANLKQMANDINNMINSLANVGSSSYEIEALQYFFSIKAKYPVDESAKEDIVDGLNDEIESLNIKIIDLMCKILDVKYEPKKGLYIDEELENSKSSVQENYEEDDEESLREKPGKPALPVSNDKKGNLDFLANMYYKEAIRSKGQWAVKSYLKAYDAFLKCAQSENDKNKKNVFLKQALKSSKDAVSQKEDSSTLYAYAVSYRELAFNNSAKMSLQAHLKVGDNFVNAAKYFLREENINEAKRCYKEAYGIYKKVPPNDEVKSRIEGVRKFL